MDAVAYFRVVDADASVVDIEDHLRATSEIAKTTLRSVLGKAELDTLLSERERLNEDLQRIIDEQTEPWGIKVVTVEIKDVGIPQDMQRAMARQAEAERDRRAKVINAEAEFQAAARLAEAADLLSGSPAAMQLRYLQTLAEVGQGRGLDRVAAAAPGRDRLGHGNDRSQRPRQRDRCRPRRLSDPRRRLRGRPALDDRGVSEAMTGRRSSRGLSWTGLRRPDALVLAELARSPYARRCGAPRGRRSRRPVRADALVRFPAVPLLAASLGKRFIVILDDVQRSAEAQTLEHSDRLLRSRPTRNPRLGIGIVQKGYDTFPGL